VEEQKIAQQKEAADAQHAEALKLLGTYQDRLGLAIVRVAPQTVRMTFSLLDERDPAREFSFVLGLGASDASMDKDADAYHVAECVPAVPALPQLLSALNADASSAVALPRFVCGIRRAFLKLAAAAKAA
jgi:hypothetical protein